MGVQSKTEIQQRSFIVSSNTRLINMKAFVAMLATVATAAAEPWLGYGYAGLPVVYGKSAPCVNATNQPVPCAAGHVLLGKREAEAESDPTLYFVNPLGARYGHPTNGFGQELVHSSNLGICTNYLGQRVPGLGC